MKEYCQWRQSCFHFGAFFRKPNMRWFGEIVQFRAVSGIGVSPYATFLILTGFVVLSLWAAGEGLIKHLEGVGFVLALFTCVMLEFWQA